MLHKMNREQFQEFETWLQDALNTATQTARAERALYPSDEAGQAYHAGFVQALEQCQMVLTGERAGVE